MPPTGAYAAPPRQDILSPGGSYDFGTEATPARWREGGVAMSRLYFIDYSKRPVFGGALRSAVEATGFLPHAGGKRVAVKVHMGERGNASYLRPFVARAVVDLLRGAGADPFVTDTTTLYKVGRFTAADYLRTAAQNGFVPETVGAPVVIADGPTGSDGVTARVPAGAAAAPALEAVEVARAVAGAQAMVVLSHVKGHDMCGTAGAIKHLGMGCTTKAGKAAQHFVNRAVLDPARCDGCGRCVESCPFDALRLEDGRPRRDDARCMSCNNCSWACRGGALAAPAGVGPAFARRLAAAAAAVAGLFSPGHVVYINFIQDVTVGCDCWDCVLPPLVGNVGIVAGLDPVAADRCSLDLVDAAPALSGPGAPAVPPPPDRLGQLNGVKSLLHIEEAAALGMGEMAYELVPATTGA